MTTLRSIIERTGRFPPVQLRIKPLSGASAIALDNFLDYQFDSSMLIPVDSFSFSFAVPDDRKIWSDYFREGDIAQLYANGNTLATGLIDTVDVEVDQDTGLKINITGRDLMGQLEDQDAISIDSRCAWFERVTVQGIFQYLAANTRIPGLRQQAAPRRGALFASEPGESKLAALQRYMEPLNIIAWMDPDGTMVIGKPNMAQGTGGSIILDKVNRFSNCLGMKAHFAAATIPNIIVPVWTGQEDVQKGSRFAPQQALKNKAQGPARLLSLNHRLPKTIIVSNPDGSNAQVATKVNALDSSNRAADATVLQAYAAREIARQNVKEVIVQVTMPGHLDNNGLPYKVDSMFTVTNPQIFDAPRLMYCYQVQYKLDERHGQITNLFLTNPGTIVADVSVQ